MEFKGRLVKLPIKTIGTSKAGKDWISCEFVIEEENQYPQKAKFKYFAQDDKMKYVDSFCEKAKIGDLLEVNFNIRCNEYNGKDYVELNAWSVKIAESNGTPNNQKVNAPTQ